VLRRHPHPSIARYHGCVIDGHRRISGLCFARYARTLRAAAEDAAWRRRHGDSCRAAIESGVRHLHGLVLVHNDLSPDNVMLDADDRPVIIDFDSCQRVGDNIGPKGGTSDWTCITADMAEVAQFSNDY
jgi:serine/threonine protein kinase